MSLIQSHFSCFTLILIMSSYAAPLKTVLYFTITRMTGHVHKMFSINSAILLHLYVKRVTSKMFIIFQQKIIMLTYTNQVFRNFFTIIHHHLTKVSAQTNKCIIFKPNELYNTIYQVKLAFMVNILGTDVVVVAVVVVPVA